MKTREQILKTFNTSRGNLLAVIIFTSVNIFLTITNTDLYFLFSASIPMILLYFGAEFSELTWSYSFSAFGIIAAFIAISFYGVCWFFSKKHRGWIVAALAFFTIDVLLMIWLLFPLDNGIDFSLVITLAFYAWIMYYLITGTKAWYKLKKMPEEEEQEQIFNGIEQGENDNKKNEIDRKTIPIAQMPLSTAIRQASKKGKVLVTQNYNNMEIVVKRAFGVTELIIDGMVYAEKTGLHEGKTYILEANVNNVIITATMEILSMKEMDNKDKFKEMLPTVYLYVNGNLLAEKVRYF
jgi:FlaA1/EpsC-like NDP-sugar epimerase